MKKLLALALAAATIYGSTPVMAWVPMMPHTPKKTVVVVNVTRAKVTTNSTTEANSGLNTINGGFGSGITTDVAVADTQVMTIVGENTTTVVDPCPCERTVTIGGSCMCGPSMTVRPVDQTTVVANVTRARVTTDSTTNANSGLNTITGSCLSDVTAGPAQATTGVVTVVGSNVTTIR